MWRFTAQTITDRNELDREFDRVRAQGFALDREETVPDGNCFGVPILKESTKWQPRSAYRFRKCGCATPGTRRRLSPLSRQAADQISAELRGEAVAAQPANLSSSRGGRR